MLTPRPLLDLGPEEKLDLFNFNVMLLIFFVQFDESSSKSEEGGVIGGPSPGPACSIHPYYKLDEILLDMPVLNKLWDMCDTELFAPG